MAIRVVRLGSGRAPDEGTRIGTVRHPPRGVPKERHSTENWFDVWFPELAPSAELVKMAQAAGNPRAWAAFVKRYRAEMAEPDKVRLIRLLATMSQQSNFSVGCYCADEARCHRSILRALLEEQGAALG